MDHKDKQAILLLGGHSHIAKQIQAVLNSSEFNVVMPEDKPDMKQIIELITPDTQVYMPLIIDDDRHKDDSLGRFMAGKRKQWQ